MNDAIGKVPARKFCIAFRCAIQNSPKYYNYHGKAYMRGNDIATELNLDNSSISKIMNAKMQCNVCYPHLNGTICAMADYFDIDLDELITKVNGESEPIPERTVFEKVADGVPLDELSKEERQELNSAWGTGRSYSSEVLATAFANRPVFQSHLVWIKDRVKSLSTEIEHRISEGEPIPHEYLMEYYELTQEVAKCQS